MKRLRIYIDTSVVGGCFDEEFAEESRALLDMASHGDAVLLVSEVLAMELRSAPENVQGILPGLPAGSVEPVSRTGESERLRDAYIEAGVLGPQSRNDALHVAIATVAGADVMVSWNFRHIVHFEKMRGFNAINLREGYRTVEILSPKEVV